MSTALRVGVGGPVGSGKTALMDKLCKSMRARYNIAAITNDIYTKEDAEFLTRSGALDPERIAFLEQEGFVQRLPGGRLKVTPEGFPVLNAVVADLAQAG